MADLNNLYQDVNQINVIKHQGEENKQQCRVGVLRGKMVKSQMCL